MRSICKEGPAWALLILRLMLGSTFILHGSQKVFGWFGGPGLEGFAASVKEMGAPEILGYAAAYFEFIGGCAVLLGFVTEIGAMLIVPVMIVAIIQVHWAQGYFAQNRGFEYPLNLLLAAIALIFGGPGKLCMWNPFWKLRATKSSRTTGASSRQSGIHSGVARGVG